MAALQLVEENSIIKVEPMETSHAVALLEKKLGTQGDGDDNGNNRDKIELVSALEFMPLGITQAGAYISQRAPRFSVRQYLDEFLESDQMKTSLLDNNAGHLRRDQEAKNSIIITWHISFEHIRQSRPSAADLLSLMSLFDRQGIPEALVRDRVEVGTHSHSKQKSQQKSRSRGIQHLTRLFHLNRDRHGSQEPDQELHEKSVGRTDEFEDDLLILRNYAFISVSEVPSKFEMHALVQLATRTWLEINGQLERWRRHYCKILCNEFPTGEYENWAKCRELFPHAQSAILHRPEQKSSLIEWTIVLYNAAWYAWRMGKPVEAEEMSIQAMKVRERILGREHNATLNSMQMASYAYALWDRWDAAEKLQLQVVKGKKKILGAEHPGTLYSIANLAATYGNQGRWNAAEKLQLQVIEAQKKTLGAEHPDTLTSMYNLAFIWRKPGKVTEAIRLMEEYVESQKHVLGHGHPNTLSYRKILDALKAEQEKVTLPV